MVLVGSGHWIIWRSSECLGSMGLRSRCESSRIELSQAQSHLGILQPKCCSYQGSAVEHEGGPCHEASWLFFGFPYKSLAKGGKGVCRKRDPRSAVEAQGKVKAWRVGCGGKGARKQLPKSFSATLAQVHSFMWLSLLCSDVKAIYIILVVFHHQEWGLAEMRRHHIVVFNGHLISSSAFS
jgi:hypothetical protein